MSSLQRLLNYIFRTIALVLLLFAGLIVLSPLINISELQYPDRLDSATVSIAHRQAQRQLGTDSTREQQFSYNPGQLGMQYKSFSVQMDNETTLKCWMIESRKNLQDMPVILILHDFNDSKISLLPMAKEFSDRGFNICLADLRAHGESSGNSFTLGNLEKYDIAKLTDTIIKQTGNPRIALMGIGIGADIALEASMINKNIKCLILQSPTDSLLSYVNRHAEKKWGFLHKFFQPIMLRNLQKETGFKIDTTVMSQLSKKVNFSISIICGTYDNETPARESRIVYDSCHSSDKEYWPLRGANHYNIPEKAGDEYYNHLGAFINSALPKVTIKRTRYRRLAEQL